MSGSRRRRMRISVRFPEVTLKKVEAIAAILSIKPNKVINRAVIEYCESPEPRIEARTSQDADLVRSVSFPEELLGRARWVVWGAEVTDVILRATEKYCLDFVKTDEFKEYEKAHATPRPEAEHQS